MNIKESRNKIQSQEILLGVLFGVNLGLITTSFDVLLMYS
jgi:hypothetical protein